MPANPQAYSVPRQPAGVPYYGRDAADAHGGVRVPVTRHAMVERRRIQPVAIEQRHICPNCRRECANKGGLASHMRGCKGEPSTD